MDFCARIWLWLGERFGARPATIIGLISGGAIFICLMTYIVIQQYSTEQEVKRVTSAFCNGSDAERDLPDNQQKCNDLLRTLLRDPDEDNARRLREIVSQP